MLRTCVAIICRQHTAGVRRTPRKPKIMFLQRSRLPFGSLVFNAPLAVIRSDCLIERIERTDIVNHNAMRRDENTHTLAHAHRRLPTGVTKKNPDTKERARSRVRTSAALCATPERASLFCARSVAMNCYGQLYGEALVCVACVCVCVCDHGAHTHTQHSSNPIYTR